MAAQSLPGRGSLARIETFWGYLFIAAPITGFLIFAAFPLVASIIISLTHWDLLTAPRWAGLDNWREALSLSVQPLPFATDEATGERLFRCGRETVLESAVAGFADAVDPRTDRPIVCEARTTQASTVLPAGMETWFDFNIGENQYVVGAFDPVLWEALFNTLILMLAIPISLGLSLALAIAMNQGIRGAPIYRAIYYLPVILPIAATALIWLWIFNPDYGLLNYLLREIGLPGNINWLQDRNTVKPALMIMGVWGGLGFQILVFLSGLQAIPRHLYEAAELDGAGGWARFRFVTWPSLTPTTFFLLITSLIGGFQNFVQPYIMTAGGPGNSSRTIVMLIYENAFRDLQMGYASTQAWFLGAIILVITIINFTLARRWVFYE
ncbi:MAG: sugar ABC transporter permease [Chloroflexota bacterium]|nr:sugar ABC transporter permease [Chloroflexota bacterium]